MIPRVRLCELGGRPAAAVSRARARCERASSAAPTSKTEEAVAPPPNTRSPSTPLEGEGGTGGFAAGQWRPSEAHKTSATAIRREKVQSQPYLHTAYNTRNAVPPLQSTLFLFTVYVRRYMYACIVITYTAVAREWINRVRLPILLVVS